MATASTCDHPRDVAGWRKWSSRRDSIIFGADRQASRNKTEDLVGWRSSYTIGRRSSSGIWSTARMQWKQWCLKNPRGGIPRDAIHPGNGPCGWGLDFLTRRRKKRQRLRRRTMLLSPLPPRCRFLLPDVRPNQSMKRLRRTEPHRSKKPHRRRPHWFRSISRGWRHQSCWNPVQRTRNGPSNKAPSWKTGFFNSVGIHNPFPEFISPHRHSCAIRDPSSDNLHHSNRPSCTLRTTSATWRGLPSFHRKHMLSKHCNISRDTSSNPCHTVWFHRICMSLQCPHNRNYCMLPLLLLLCRVSSLCGVLLLVGCDTHSFFKKLTDFVLAVLRSLQEYPHPWSERHLWRKKHIQRH